MGHVVYGRQIGRTIGVPTANIRLQRYRSALSGVFCVAVHGLDRRYIGVANIGVRPTVHGSEPLLEVHIFDFDEDIYGRLLTVTVRHKLRDERKFPSLEALKAQIETRLSGKRRTGGRHEAWLLRLRTAPPRRRSVDEIHGEHTS